MQPFVDSPFVRPARINQENKVYRLSRCSASEWFRLCLRRGAEPRHAKRPGSPNAVLRQRQRVQQSHPRPLGLPHQGQDRVQPAGKPTDNAFIEAFNGTFQDDCLNAEWLNPYEMPECKIVSRPPVKVVRSDCWFDEPAVLGRQGLSARVARNVGTKPSMTNRGFGCQSS